MNARAPFGAVVMLAALVAGILLGQLGSPTAAVPALIAALAALAVAASRRPSPTRLLVAALGFLLLGGAVMQRALHGLTASPLTAPVAQRADARLRATLVDDPDGGRFDVRALVRADRVDGAGAGGRLVLVRADGDAAARLRLLAAGDGVDARGWFEPLDGFDTRWRWRHAVGAFHVTDFVDASHARSPVDRVANRVRALVLAGSARLAPVDRALLAGFLLGDTRAVPPDLTERFRAAGLTHLTAVSGENVAFVLAVFAPLLRRLGVRGRVPVAIALLLLFGTMTRWEPSVLRAIAMAVLALLAGFLGRPVDALRALVLAAIVLLVADPFLVHSVGFLLSCGASLGIALLARPLAARLPGPAWVTEVLAVTAAAQIGVAPVLIPVFGSMPLVALPANLVAVPLAAPLTIWGLVAGVLGGLVAPFAPRVADLLQLPTRALLHALVTVADVSSRVPVAVDGRAAWGVIAVVAAIAAVLRLHHHGRRSPARR